MTKLIKSIIIIVAFNGCASEKINDTEKINEIDIFNGITFEIMEGEQIVNIKANEKEDFRSHFNDSSTQIPLFKCIKSDEYYIYIGIPISTSIVKLLESKNQNHTQNLNTDSISYYHLRYNKENEYVTEYSVDVENNILCILAVSKSNELSDSLFNYKSISKRLKLSNHE